MKIKVIDNFLEEIDLNSINSINLKKINGNEIKVYQNSIHKSGETKLDCFDENFIKKLHSKYHNKALNILKELNPKKISLYDYSEFHIIETGYNSKFPTHDDTPNKLLSGVIYLKPESNSGTSFYDTKKGEGKKTIDWRVNRAVFFSRVERETWHSYEGDRKNNRIVLVYNLMTRNIKGVYKAENKNYLLGLIRFKLNPFLYRFFKKTL